MISRNRVSAVRANSKIIWLNVFVFMFLTALFVSVSQSIVAEEFNETMLDIGLTNSTINESIIESSYLSSPSSLAAFDIEIYKINITRNNFTDNLTSFSLNFNGNVSTLYNETSVMSSVELEFYKHKISSDLTICAFYVNGSSNFSCSITETLDGNYSLENLTKIYSDITYLLVGVTEIDLEIYYNNQTLNLLSYLNESIINISSNIYVNLTSDINETINETVIDDVIIYNETQNVSVSKIDMTIIERDYETLIEIFNLTVKFKEAYKGRHIFGDISVMENNSYIFETVEVNIAPFDEPSNITMCHYDVNGTSTFNCTLERLKTGLYEINVNAWHDDEIYEVRELTYVQIPEFTIDIATNLSSNESIIIDDAITTKEINNTFAKNCYWDLMNEVRSGPYMRKFQVTRYLKMRY